MPSDNPLVSIIMPAYNCEKYIAKAISSIVSQTYTHWEFLICDDASLDKTYEIIVRHSEKDKRIKVFRNTKNKKQVSTRNFLISQAIGELIALQDADDWSSVDRIAKQVEEFCLHPDLGICGTYAQYYDASGKVQTLKKKLEATDSGIKENISRKNQFCGASIMVRKEVLLKTGSYRDYFSGIGNEDYDLTSRIVQLHQSKNIPEYLYCVRQTSGSSSRNILTEQQLISSEIVRRFILQRSSGKEDYLDTNDLDGLHKMEEELTRPFKDDQSLIFRKSADINWYNGDAYHYFKSASYALKKDPFKMINWKYFTVASFRLIYFNCDNLIRKNDHQ